MRVTLCVMLAATGCEEHVRNVRYVPSEDAVIDVMLRLADIKPGEVVYDLGCGDGRIVIAAVRERGARGVCVDIDPVRTAQSRINATAVGVAERIRFATEDLRATDVSDANVVMLFLSPELNLAVRPNLERMLKPGARVVSHWHDMGDWKPRQTVRVKTGDVVRPVYLWTIEQ